MKKIPLYIERRYRCYTFLEYINSLNTPFGNF